MATRAAPSSEAEVAGPETQAKLEEVQAGRADIPVTRRLVTRRGGTTVWVAQDDHPWTSPLDALVIPVATGGGAGQLAHALLEDLGARHPDLHDFGPPLDEPRHLTPEEPVVLARSEAWVAAGLPANLVLATAERRTRLKGSKANPWSAENAGIAAKTVVKLANRHGWARIAIPLLGAGKAGLPPVEVAEEVLHCTLGALPAPAVREITLVTLDQAAFAFLAERAHARSQSFANDLPAGDDLLDVETEVAALAEAMLLRDLEPPLVVGVLGGWGSGKSFVMHLMRERISEIRALCVESAEMAWGQDREQHFPYVGHPYVITFDAWTYANADLWASLMQTVFRELSRQLALEAKLKEVGVDPLAGGSAWKALALMNDPERMAVLAAGLEGIEQDVLRTSSGDAGLSDVLWERLMKLKQDELAKLEATKQQRLSVEAGLAAAKKQLGEAADAELDRAARRAAWKPLAKVVGGAVTEALKQVAPVPPGEEPLGPKDLEQLQAVADHVSFAQRLWSSPWVERFAFLGVALATAATPFLRTILAQFQWPALGAGAIAALLGARRLAARWDEKFADIRRQYETGWVAERAKIAARRDAIMAELQAGTQIPALERELRKLEAEEAACQEKIGTPAGFVSLAEFVRARLDASTYESKLGLMHQVQRDIASLSDCLVVYDRDLQRAEKTSFFPRGPARVVLFIDDLDRCPPDQVVAVLEAVQLLVKTRLFVVVLAMDVRYVTRALEKRYEKILCRNGDPSGLDYIEKIVQVPYRVRPIDPQAFEPFVRSQMRVKAPPPPSTGLPGSRDAGRPVAPRGPEAASHEPPPRIDLPLTRSVLEFSLEEVDIVRDCCATVELSPRSVKRVVNVYKLLKIVWYRGARYVEPKPDVKRAMVMLLALAARHPEAMRDLLDELSEAAKSDDASPVIAWLRSRCRKRAETDRQATRWTELALSLARQSGMLEQVSVRNVGVASCNLVRSFSFLGDIGAEPDEAQDGRSSAAQPVGGSRGQGEDADRRRAHHR